MAFLFLKQTKIIKRFNEGVLKVMDIHKEYYCKQLMGKIHLLHLN